MADATSKQANMADCGERLNNTMNKLDTILDAFWTRISQSDSHQRPPNKVLKRGSETQADTQSLSQDKHQPPAASKPHQICGTQPTKTAPTTRWNKPATP
ncbi:Hypothetical predicted protein [Pelobates cultripes]|uniref:Uncharacterized protein n=1 Tax=Pelobates cultripes TaxID=61616 RepID=A0AAD1SHU7_PELCU|nr:Hypothetical predicted protein [Pelobates cultripes]